MRDAIVANGGKAEFINPEIPVDLVIDHSVQVIHTDVILLLKIISI